MSELASCNYAARKFGIRNGMFVGEALKLCPDLVLIQYNFKQYQKISQQFYEILLQYSSEIEAISCDEAFIDLTDYVNSIGEAESLVKQFRDEVKSKTGCAVSAGISHNILLARMCTTAAKPDHRCVAARAQFLPIIRNYSQLPIRPIILKIIPEYLAQA